MLATTKAKDIKLAYFRPEDLKELGENLIPNYLARLFAQNEGLAYTAIDEEGRVLGCAGVFLLWPGVGEAWSFLSPELLENPFWLHRTVKRILWNIIKTDNLRRVHVLVLEGYETGYRWAERLGFKDEGIMENYGPKGETYRRYVVLRKTQ